MKSWTLNSIKVLVAFMVFPLLSLQTNAAETITTVDISRSGFVLNRSTNTFDSTVTIKNIGSYSLAPPLRIAVASVSPKSVSLYNIYGKTADGHPYVEISLPNYKLAPNESMSVPIRFVNLGKSVTAAQLYVIANELNPGNTRTIHVTGRFNEENGGGSIGAGFIIKADGVAIGETNQNGLGTIDIISSAQEVSISQAPNYFGSKPLSTGNNTENLFLEVGDSAELSAGAKMRIDRIQHLMLPFDVAQIGIRFYQAEKQILPDLIENIEYRDPAGGKIVDIKSIFSKRADGTLVATPVQLYSKIGGFNGKKTIFAQILDQKGVSHFSEQSFYISRYKVIGKLLPPPSNPSLNLGGVPITVSIFNTDISFETESAADGSFPLPSLPAGNISIKAHTTSQGTTYIAHGFAVLSGDTELKVTLRGPGDIAANVPVLSSTPL